MTTKRWKGRENKCKMISARKFILRRKGEESNNCTKEAQIGRREEKDRED